MRPETKPDYKRTAHWLCHPERSEGSLREILRCAQNDTTGWPHCKASKCTEVWFTSRFLPNP
jgi:hypothetical protein